MTISLVAAFIPVLFMSGMLGRLIVEFAVTICVAIFGFRLHLIDLDTHAVQPLSPPSRMSKSMVGCITFSGAAWTP